MDLIPLIIVLLIAGILFLFLRMWFLTGYRGASTKEKINKPTVKSESSTKTKYSMGKIIETNTSYQSLGTEERIIDNSQSDGLVRRKLKISREWKKTITIDKEENDHFKGKVGISVLLIEAEISKTIKEKYSFTIEETHHFSEELELEIVPHSKVVLSIDWKMILQNGEIEVFSDTNETIRVPFHIVKGITFDQMQQKVN